MKPFVPALVLVAIAACGTADPPQAAHQARAERTPVTQRTSPSPAARSLPARPSSAPSELPARHQSVIIAGDSIPEDLGPMITRTLNGPLFSGHTESHPSTGLVRADYFDWPAAAGRIADEHPDTVILLMGGNDNQPMKPAGAAAYAAPASAAWDAEYARRAGLVLDALRDGGVHRVYWLTLPKTDLPGMNVAVAAMGQAIRAAAKGRQGVTVYDTDVLLGSNAGTPVAHQPDGIHLSTLGSQMISNALIGRLRIDASSQDR